MADKLKQRIDRHDHEMAVIRAAQLKTNGILGKLARGMLQLQAAQKRTEQALANYISRTTPRNGHTKRKVDLQ